MGPLLALALGCAGDPTTKTDDGPDDSTPAPDSVDTGDSGNLPEVQFFEPAYVYAVGHFGWSAETGTGGGYLWTNGATIPPQIELTIYAGEFLLDGDHADGACGLVLVYDLTEGPLAAESWTFTAGDTDHRHLGFRLPSGTFTVLDAPDAKRGMLGCSRHEFDPERFPGGVFAAIHDRDWGFGFGTLDADLMALVGGDDDYAGTAALLDDDVLAGGSMLGAGDPPYDPRWFARGYALDEDGRILVDVPLTTEQMVPPAARVAAPPPATGDTARSPTGDTAASTPTGDTGLPVPPPGVPATGAYVVFPPNWVSASTFWP